MESSGRTVFHIPTEVCENIIDMLYSYCTPDTSKNIATLHSCALVCRAWRIRSQRMLFYRVQLSDGTSLHQLSTILHTGQHLRSYVHQVDLIGYSLHTTASIFALFPAVFAGKLPNIKEIRTRHILPGTTWFTRTSDLPAKAKALPYIPLHSRFPNFLSSFTSVSSLWLECTTFRSFSEIARILHGLPNLEELTCDSVRWVAPGGSHLGANFTKQPDWAAGRRTLPPFAPKLRELGLLNMAMYGAERLIWTRGPHLTWLFITIPLSDSPEEPAHARGINLSPCTRLEELYLSITPQFSTDTHAEFVKELLASWKPQCVEPLLIFGVDLPEHFTCQGFADILRGLGTIAETWLQTVEEPSPASGSEDDHRAQYRLRVEIYDWEAERGWWSDHVDSCFPTWLQLGRLSWTFHTPLNESLQWAVEEKSSLSDTIPHVENDDLNSWSKLKAALRLRPRVSAETSFSPGHSKRVTLPSKPSPTTVSLTPKTRLVNPTLDVILSRTRSATRTAATSIQHGLRRLRPLPVPRIPRDAKSLTQSRHTS
ncbi:hypothetical protein LXA43DRAFT_171741 [Ganoderma leucocontextum]|nr:hypothetical protein LXA43DRAFT_171741 [Ganoderma leucocontextum]